MKRATMARENRDGSTRLSGSFVCLGAFDERRKKTRWRTAHDAEPQLSAGRARLRSCDDGGGTCAIRNAGTAGDDDAGSRAAASIAGDGVARQSGRANGD